MQIKFLDEDERNVQELEPETTVGEEHQDTRKLLKSTTRDEARGTRKELKTTTRTEARGTRTEIKRKSHGEARGSRKELKATVRNESRDIKDQLGEMQQSIERLSSSAANFQSTGAFLRLRIDCQAITGPDTQREAARTTVTPQEPQEDGDVPSTQGILNSISSKYFQAVDASKTEGLNDFLQYLKEKRKVLFVHSQPGSWSQGLAITVECSSLQVLDELWEDFNTGHLNEMAQRYLVTEDILKAFGITGITITTAIPKNEYKACRMYFLKPTATDWSAVGEDDNNGDLPENQDSPVTSWQTLVNIEQLHIRRKELCDAFLRWIPIRARTMEQLEQLATKLDEHYRNATKATITGASMGTVGGILAIAGLITAPFTFGAGLIVSLVGAGIGGTGGLVMSGSKVAQKVLEKSGLKEVQAAIDEDRDACEKLQQQLDSLENFISSQAEFLKPIFNDPALCKEFTENQFQVLPDQEFFEDAGSSTKEKAEFCARFFRVAGSAATIPCSAVATAAALARSAAIGGTRAAHFAGSAIGVVLLPIDIALLVKSSLELHRGCTSEAVEYIRKILNELKCPKEKEIEDFLKTFIEKKLFELK